MYEKNVERLGESERETALEVAEDSMVVFLCYKFTAQLADTQPLRCMSRFLPESSSPLRDRELVNHESKAY